MLERRNALVAACLIIAICISTITAMTYSLFTDTVSVTNHLKAGSLDVELKRTALEYCVLDENGVLTVHKVNDVYDFTDPTNENVFGIDSKDISIVPGCYFETTMQFQNKGNIACVYNVQIKLIGEANDLAKQLKVTITYPDNTTVEKTLADLTEDNAFESKITAAATMQTFKVRVEFIDDLSGNTSDNNLAQGQSAVFDLVVSAVQATQPAKQ